MRRAEVELILAPEVLFQSLAGFLARCDLPSARRKILRSGSFNPWRVFWLVATSGSVAAKLSPIVLFQSLAGFLARCDFWRRCCISFSGHVSIPGGFSGSLRHPGCDPCHPHRSGFNPWRVFWLVATGDILRGRLQDIIVSIPGGFSGSLRLDDPGNQISHRFGFNPWRVFWLVATHRSG